MPRTILWIYVIASIANVFAQVLPSEELNRFTKPLLMPLLLFYIYKKSIGNTTLKVLLLSGAILFSWFGDVALMYQKDQSYFILGIGLFLTAQMMYVIILRKATFQKSTWNLLKLYPIGTIIYGGILFFLLLPAGTFTIPIILYGIVIISMTLSAFFRQELTSIESYRLALMGSILFVLSDSALAINAFSIPFQFSGAVVMTTYCSAQYFLVEGILRHPD